MPLPADDTAWPPPGHAERYRTMRRNAVWLGGDPDQLASQYAGTATRTTGGPATTVNPQGAVRRAINAFRNPFWGQQSQADEPDTKRHLPLAQDIATMSSELLFSEAPEVKVMGPTYDADGPAGADGTPVYRKGDPRPETVAAQTRLDKVLDDCNWQATLLAAAEIASALGSTGLRIALDPSGPFANQPMLARVDADHVVPYYSWGQLMAVEFWQVVRTDKGDVVWRHIEHHERGVVYHGLYRGTSASLGKRQPLEADPSTAPLAAAVDSEGAIVLSKSGGKTGTSIPNMLPDPLDRESHAGRSDYTPAVIDLFQSADQMFSQMMDEAEDGRSRLFIAESMLRDLGAGKGVAFDASQRVFSKVRIPPKEGGSSVSESIEKIQFEVRLSMWLDGIAAIEAKTIRAAGFNTQTLGDETGDGGAITATEFTGRNRRSMSTRDKKARYWIPELSQLLTTMLAIDVERFAPHAADGSLIQAFPVQVTLPDAVQATVAELAADAKAMKDADAASIRDRVEYVHPEWTPEHVDQTVEALSAVDPTSFGVAGAGVTPDNGLGL